MQRLLHYSIADDCAAAVVDFVAVVGADGTVPADFRDCWVWIS